MELGNSLWATLEGGYKVPYDVSIPLKKLSETNDQNIIEEIFGELWDNLHHQGDVGIASYAAVPHLVSICIERKSLDGNFVGLCILIEHCRLAGHNPELPEKFQGEYHDALSKLEKYLLSNYFNIKDPTTFQLTLALFATLHGQPELGMLIEKLDEDDIKIFLQKY